jgi:hypothetical protein
VCAVPRSGCEDEAKPRSAHRAVALFPALSAARSPERQWRRESGSPSESDSRGFHRPRPRPVCSIRASISDDGGTVRLAAPDTSLGRNRGTGMIAARRSASTSAVVPVTERASARTQASLSDRRITAEPSGRTAFPLGHASSHR